MQEVNRSGGTVNMDINQLLSVLYGQLGQVFSQLDENERAFKYLNQAIQCDDSNMVNWISLATLELKLNKGDSCS